MKEIKVTRVTCFANGGVGFNMDINGVSIYGCKVVDGKNGQFIGFPQEKGKDGKYYSKAYCKLTPDETKNILNQIESLK